MRRDFLLVILAAGAASCEGRGPTIPVGGAYTRAAFHLLISCPGDAQFHEADLLYPLDTENETYTIAEDPAGPLSVSFGGVTIGSGVRSRDDVDFVLSQHDPFVAPEIRAWRFHGRVRDDLVFHERTISGNVEYGSFETGGELCSILPGSVAWFSTKARELERTSVGFSGGAQARGSWSRFVWFLEIGPLPMEKKGDPGQRGRNIALFSFLSSAGGTVTATDDAALVNDGLPQDGGPGHPASANGSALEYRSTNADWDLTVEQDVVFDDGLPHGTAPGFRRVLAGFVHGTVRVDPTLYPFGWTGPTGDQPLQIPGMAFFTDEDSGPSVPAPFAPSSAPPASIETGRALVVWDGVPLPNKEMQ